MLDNFGNLERGLPEGLLEKRCCRRAYLRGAFLAKGSVTNPEKGYHLEIVAEDEVHAQAIADMMVGFEVAGKVTSRKGESIVYVKESDQIARFLGLVGAHTAVLQFENVRVVKDMRNRVNRLTNAESANMDKAVAAAVQQVDDISLIQEKIGLQRLPHGLRELAKARLENPEASLRELGESITPRVSKSGINYRFTKISEIAKRLRNGESDRFETQTTILAHRRKSRN
jgi:DNA-binding protein WhiA